MLENTVCHGFKQCFWPTVLPNPASSQPLHERRVPLAATSAPLNRKAATPVVLVAAGGANLNGLGRFPVLHLAHARAISLRLTFWPTRPHRRDATQHGRNGPGTSGNRSGASRHGWTSLRRERREKLLIADSTTTRNRQSTLSAGNDSYGRFLELQERVKTRRSSGLQTWSGPDQ